MKTYGTKAKMKKYYQLGAINPDGTKAIDPRILDAESVQAAIDSVPEDLKKIFAANKIEFSARRVSMMDLADYETPGDHAVGKYEYYLDNGSFLSYPIVFNHPEALFYLRVTESEFLGQKVINKNFVVYERPEQVVATWRFEKWMTE